MSQEFKTRALVMPSRARQSMLRTGMLTGGFLFIGALMYSATTLAAQEPLARESAVARTASPKPVADTEKWSASRSLYYKRNWGVEVIGVHSVSSGYMLDFRYRIVDPAKARPLNDMKGKAYVIDEASGTRLAVPAMENVGELRSGSDPVADRTYFMIFGNPGRLVKPGSRVSVVIGNFRVDGLVVN